MKITQSLFTTMRRVLAISDLHVDYRENLDIVKQWSPTKYNNDVLIVAGDVTDSLPLLKETLCHLSDVFNRVFYVPGNHELWIKEPGKGENSISKFHKIITICKAIGIATEPELLPLTDNDKVWIFPLFSWYSTPEEDGANSLYIENNKSGQDDSHSMWMDNHLCRWPDLESKTRSKYFADLNSQSCPETFSHPVISFSHFLPRKDLINPSEHELQEIDGLRQKLGLESVSVTMKSGKLNPRNFNFSRYAGCSLIESQIRHIGSVVHVFGHQHRNKERLVDGVKYVSHCLGYRRERDKGLVTGLDTSYGPKQIWPNK